MAAAVADFRPRDPADHKLKKDGGPPRARARADRGRAQRAGRRAGAPARCSSASPPSTATARSPTRAGKLERKRLDAIVVNDISQPGIGFDAADNEVTIVTADGGERLLRRGREGRDRRRRPG